MGTHVAVDNKVSVNKLKHEPQNFVIKPFPGNLQGIIRK